MYDRGGSSEVRTLPLAKFLPLALIELEVALYMYNDNLLVLTNLNLLYTLVFVRMYRTRYPFASTS